VIKKDALLELLKKGLDDEEKAIPIYTKHLKSAVLWTGLEEKEAEEVRCIIEKLATDSEGHKKIVLSLIDSIERSGKDAF
jgi:rubrerythrin